MSENHRLPDYLDRIAHGYFDINLDVVWETTQEWLPALLKNLPAVRQDAEDPNAKWYPHEEIMQSMHERISQARDKPC